MRVLDATSSDTFFLSQSRTDTWTSWACWGVATLPVPMAQTGSYAITISSQPGTLSAHRKIHKRKTHHSVWHINRRNFLRKQPIFYFHQGEKKNLPANAFNCWKQTSKVFPASLSSSFSPIQAMTLSFWSKAYAAFFPINWKAEKEVRHLQE